jgi:hypothetical protein
MRLPTQRLTISPTEYLLLKPGLDILANGLASAKAGNFPYRHAFFNIDLAASNLYRDRSYDDQMASRIIGVRAKLWELSKSRKVRMDAFEVTAAALALRLQKAPNEGGASKFALDYGHLASKLETYRKRAKRAAIAKLGAVRYQQAAKRWKNFAAWVRFNLLQFKLPKRGIARRKALWRLQRTQLCEAIRLALKERYYDALDGRELERIVDLLAASLRRGRHALGLRALLASPRDHTGFLIGWVEKRSKLEPGSNTPIAPWRAASERAERFQTFIKQRTTIRTIPAKAIPAQNNSLSEAAISALELTKENRGRPVFCSSEDLCEALTQWLYETVTLKFDFTREVCEAARYQIKHGLVDQYRRSTVGTSLENLAEELCPDALSDDAAVVIGEFAGWMLSCLLSLGREPEWIYGAIGTACDGARRLKENARHGR